MKGTSCQCPAAQDADSRCTTDLEQHENKHEGGHSLHNAKHIMVSPPEVLPMGNPKSPLADPTQVLQQDWVSVCSYVLSNEWPRM